MNKRNTARSEAEVVTLRVVAPFIHRGARRLVGELIECTADEAQGALFHGWAVALANGHGAQREPVSGRHNRRDMRAKS